MVNIIIINHYDALYQAMLSCWMSDMDERPTAAGLAQLLAEMAQDGQLHMNFSLQQNAAAAASFQYEPFNNDLELQR